MNNTYTYSIDITLEEVEILLYRLQRKHEEQELAEIITKYDFIVGSKECKQKLMEILPEGASVIYSPYIESPTTVYAIKKFDTQDLIMGTYAESEDEK